MRLLEYEAKTLLRTAGVATPKSQLITQPDSEFLHILPTVIKAQVLTGRRNKFGGIQLVREQEKLAEAVRSVFVADIDGYTATSVLAEELLDIDREFYLNVSVDRDEQAIVLMAHKDGGVDIESQPLDAFFREVADDTTETQVLRLAEYLGLESQEFALGELIGKIVGCMRTQDALLCEINPLVLTRSGTLIAADCKMELDNAASFRHPDWDFYDKPTSSNFVELDKQGTVATIANGAGLAMATVDAVSNAGYSPANFLDIGGGASKDTVLAAFHELMNYPLLNAIVINIFAGITRCDEVARAILAAREEIANLPRLYIRLDGTNVDQAKEILAESQLPLYPSLGEAVAAIGAHNV